MKYFTPELYIRWQSEDDDVERLWDEAADCYEKQLQVVLPRVPRAMRELLANHYLHDAVVLTLGQHDNTFVIVLQLDPPYRTLVLTYTLDAPALINRQALPAEYCSRRIDWLYDEVDLESADSPVCLHTILLSNGWELHLRFADFQVTAFRSLLLGESQRKRADECERLGAQVNSTPHSSSRAGLRG